MGILHRNVTPDAYMVWAARLAPLNVASLDGRTLAADFPGDQRFPDGGCPPLVADFAPNGQDPDYRPIGFVTSTTVVLGWLYAFGFIVSATHAAKMNAATLTPRFDLTAPASSDDGSTFHGGRVSKVYALNREEPSAMWAGFRPRFCVGSFDGRVLR